MDEKRILGLVKAAVELEALAAEVDRRKPDSAVTEVPRRTRRWPWVVGVLASAAACIAFVLTSREELQITELTVRPSTVRRSEAELQMTIGLSRPAYVSVILVDERYERWLVPFDRDQDRFLRYIQESDSFRFGWWPQPDDPRGAAKAIAVMVVAAKRPQPSKEDLLRAIPDPIAPSVATERVWEQELDAIKTQLQRRFDCAVRVEILRW